eukprot:gene16008-22146_t
MNNINSIFNNPFKKKERELAAKEEADKEKERWRDMAVQQAQSATQSQLASQARVRDLIRQGSAPTANQFRSASQHSFKIPQEPARQPPAQKPAAPREAPGDLLPKVQAMLNTLRSMSASDIRAFPVLNEAQRNVQLLQDFLNNLSPDESEAWRFQILDLQQEVKAQTSRILSSVDPPPAQAAPAIVPASSSQQNAASGALRLGSRVEALKLTVGAYICCMSL